MKKRNFALVVAALGILYSPLLSSPAYAAGDAPHAPEQDWSFNGVFGTYDRGALQRGLKVYQSVCAACHGMKHLAYRNLTALGYNENQVKNIAAGYTVMDGPNDEGEMFDRPGLPSDHFVSPYPNEKAAAYANNGAIPPDLSLITKARHDGSNYVYGLLTGYGMPEHGETVSEGKYWNKYFPGHIISMAPPLSDDMIAYEDGAPQTVEQYSKDVVQFLTWAADPYMEDRKKIGIRVILFLMIFAGIMYAVKRRLWAKLH
jgi:ubiquinol-cytochrome c reductase cytochrome c1 subunit